MPVFACSAAYPQILKRNGGDNYGTRNAGASRRTLRPTALPAVKNHMPIDGLFDRISAYNAYSRLLSAQCFCLVNYITLRRGEIWLAIVNCKIIHLDYQTRKTQEIVKFLTVILIFLKIIFKRTMCSKSFEKLIDRILAQILVKLFFFFLRKSVKNCNFR